MLKNATVLKQQILQNVNMRRDIDVIIQDLRDCADVSTNTTKVNLLLLEAANRLQAIPLLETQVEVLEQQLEKIYDIGYTDGYKDKLQTTETL